MGEIKYIIAVFCLVLLTEIGAYLAGENAGAQKELTFDDALLLKVWHTCANNQWDAVYGTCTGIVVYPGDSRGIARIDSYNETNFTK